MPTARPIPPEFHALLAQKSDAVIALFTDLRACVLAAHPAANELLYHTHALTSVFSLSDKLADAYCMIPIYSNHLNLGFNKGTRLPDPHGVLAGTGNLMRHIPVKTRADYRNAKVTALMKAAVAYAVADMDVPSRVSGSTISKIKSRE